MNKISIGLIGMPFYTARLEKELRQYDPHLDVRAYNTYTSYWGKLKYALKASAMDVIFSINGENRKSRAFSWGMNRDVSLVMNWSGSDVLTATKNFKRGEVDEKLVKYARHTCQCSWIQNELKSIGIYADLIQFQAYEPDESKIEIDRLQVLSRINQDRPDFYGMRELIVLAKEFPSIVFSAVGIESYSKALPENLHLLGWVDDMDSVFKRHLISIRFPEHDGLSTFVLESLARGKHVLYRYPLQGTMHTPDLQSMITELRVLKDRFDKGELDLNKEGMKMIEDQYNQLTVFSSLLKYLHKEND